MHRHTQSNIQILYIHAFTIHGIPAYIHSRINDPACIRAFMHPSMHTSNLPYIHPYPCIQTSIHPSIHMSLHPYVPPSIHTSIHLSVHPSMHPYINTNMYAYMYICTFTYFSIFTFHHAKASTLLRKGGQILKIWRSCALLADPPPSLTQGRPPARVPKARPEG